MTDNDEEDRGHGRYHWYRYRAVGVRRRIVKVREFGFEMPRAWWLHRGSEGIRLV
jgi:hypothetical protein